VLLVLGLIVGTNGWSSARAAEGDWAAIECVPADLPPDALFDVGQVVADFEDAMPKWEALRGGQNAHAVLRRDDAECHGGKASLRVDYEFSGRKDYDYVQIAADLELPQPGTGFGFWLKTDGTAFPLRLRFADKSGETHQVDMLSAARPGWQFVAATFDGHSTAWGGDGNQRKDYPCRLTGICMDRPAVGFRGQGTLWIDDAALLKPRAVARGLAVEIRGKRFGNLYDVGETATLRARGPGQRIRWRAADYWGREIAAGDGPAAGTQVAFALARPGYYACTLELLDGDRLADARRLPCAALPGGRQEAASDFVGMCSHYGQNAYPLESMELMRRYGIDQFRDEISWRGYERTQGKYEMPSFAQAYIKRAAELKMRPLIIFDYNNPHYDQDGFPNSPEAIAAFARYAVDLARQTRGSVRQFEVWNEWVGGCGMRGRPGTHDGAAYGRLLKPTYEAVKAAVPEATVCGIGGEYGPRCAEHILGAVSTAGPSSMDAWSIHPYRYPRPPEASDLTGEVRRIAERVAAAGARQKVWITEIGYPTHRTSGGSPPDAQARLAVRTLVLLQSTGLVEKVFWYDFKDDGLGRDYNEHNFGVVHHQQFNCAPKPAIVAICALVGRTAGAEFKSLKQDGETFIAAYRQRDGSDLLVAWTTRGQRAATIVGKCKAAVDLMGGPLPADTAVSLTESPVYLLGENLSLRFAAP
jgi:hypothetical protein